MTNDSSEHPPERARFGPFEVDLQTRELWKFGTRLKLVGQPFAILAMLLSRPGKLVTRDELRNRLWPADTFVDFNHGLNAAVNKLRETLSDSADDPRYIETLPRRGYRFRAELEWVEGAAPVQSAKAYVPELPSQQHLVSSPASIESIANTSAISQVIAPDTLAARPSSLPRYIIFGSLLAATLIVGAVLFHSLQRDGKGTSHTSIERTGLLIPVADTSGPSFSPDGNSVAFFRQHSAEAESGIYVTSVGSNQLLQLTSNGDDCCPVWSPDGRWIAFTRAANRDHSIFIVPADGGREEKRKAEKVLPIVPAAFRLASSITTERKLDTGGVAVSRGEIDWSADGKSIAFSGPSGLYLLAIDSAAARRITVTPPSAEEWGPAFSPDGDNVMYVRSQIGVPDQIWVASSNGAEPRRLLSERGKIASPPQWSIDGRSIIFSSNRTGHPALWRAALDAPDAAVQISEAGSPAWDPAVSRRGYRLAYERLMRSLSIWEMDLSESREKRPYVLVSPTSETDQGPGPQYSPDGAKLAYMSDRTGTMEIWVSDRDGSHAFQLSAVGGGAGTPRWSPDSQFIAFDTMTQNGSKIVVMNVNGGTPQVLTSDTFHNVCPSWSRDGKWIYFGSPRTNGWQVWKMPTAGGAAVQVTQRGGHAALESLDGKFIYYSKNPNPEPEIWRVPVNGGEEMQVSLVRPGTWASWQVVEGGILFVGPSLGHQAVLSFFDSAKNRTTSITVLDRIPFWLGATTDGRTIAFDQPGREQGQAMLVENFR
jgi:Tol biopolymer transport system component/DNA-binding winged helix-turn-helix (wHTH) protein